ncbi:MAG: hypothetical protein WCG64_05260 [Flavobacteriia bacterium]
MEQEAKIYVYRDVIGGLDEQFHRIYSVKDNVGQHVVVERYAADGRLLEALNFNLDSLDIQDHMVVNNQQKKTQAMVYKTKYFPWNQKETTWFATKFEGVMDSTLIFYEMKRTLRGDEALLDVMGENQKAIKYKDRLRYTMLNPFTKKEKEINLTQYTYYAENIGLVEWKSTTNQKHFKLEQILTQQEWVKIIAR